MYSAQSAATAWGTAATAGALTAPATDNTVMSAPAYNCVTGTAFTMGETMTHTAADAAAATTVDTQIKTGAATTFQGVAWKPASGTTEG